MTYLLVFHVERFVSGFLGIRHSLDRVKTIECGRGLGPPARIPQHSLSRRLFKNNRLFLTAFAFTKPIVRDLRLEENVDLSRHPRPNVSKECFSLTSPSRLEISTRSEQCQFPSAYRHPINANRYSSILIIVAGSIDEVITQLYKPRFCRH